MTEQEADDLLKSKTVNKTLKEIKVYNHHQPYPFIEKNEAVVISAAVELTFDDAVIAFHWHAEDHIFNFSFQSVELDEEWDDIEVTNIDTYSNLRQQTIQDIETNWTYFQRLDENFEIIDEKLFVPQELIINFSNGSQLQIACVDFNVDPASSDLINLSYNMNSGILVSPVVYEDIKSPDFNEL